MATETERFDRFSGGQPYKPSTRALDPNKVVIEPGWNARNMHSPETLAHIEELKVSILARINSDPPLSGLIEPVKVRFDRASGVAKVTDGECRTMAYRSIWADGMQAFMPCEEVKGTLEQLIATSLTSNTGLPLTQWELGTKCNRLKTGFNWSVEKIAAHCGKSKKYITEAIALSLAPPEAKQMIEAGDITPALVLHEVDKNKDNPEAAVKSLAVAVKKAKDSGQKTAKRARKSTAAELIALTKKVMHDVKKDEIENDGYQYVSVDRLAMIELAKLADAYPKK